MGLTYTTTKEAHEHIVNNIGKQDIIVVYISELETSETEDYENLATLLGTTKINDGFYICESGDVQQRIFVNVVSADIILNISLSAGTTFTFDDFWELRKLRDDVWIDWGDGTIDSNTSHTYTDDFEGTIKIYDYGIVKHHFQENQGYYTQTDSKSSIVSVEFVKPQIVKNANYLFSSFINLVSVKGCVYLIQTESTSTVMPLFYNCGKLTTLNNFIIYTTETNPGGLRCIFQNCSSANDDTLKGMRFVNLDFDNITNYQRAFVSTQITKIPKNIVGKNGTNFDSCFVSCKGLSKLPGGIFDNCQNGYSAFLDSGVVDVADDFVLPNLVKGGSMFSATKLCKEAIVKIYNSLPTISEDAAPTQPTDRDTSLDYAIVFGFVDGDETAIQEALGLDSFPKAASGQYIKASNGWWIAFDNVY